MSLNWLKTWLVKTFAEDCSYNRKISLYNSTTVLFSFACRVLQFYWIWLHSGGFTQRHGHPLVVFLMFLCHTKNSQSNFFLLTTQRNHVLWISTISLDSSCCVAAIRLADACVEAGKVENAPTFDRGNTIDVMHWSHNSVQQRNMSPHSKSMETDTDKVCNTYVWIHHNSWHLGSRKPSITYITATYWDVCHLLVMVTWYRPGESGKIT